VSVRPCVPNQWPLNASVCRLVGPGVCRDLPYVGLLEATLGSREALRDWLRQIMSALDNNLELKSQALADERLQHLFLMNNKESYVFVRVATGKAISPTAYKRALGLLALPTPSLSQHLPSWPQLLLS